MIRAPATRAVFAEHAAGVEQLDTLLIRAVCILAAHQGSITLQLDIFVRWTHQPGLHSPNLYQLS